MMENTRTLTYDDKSTGRKVLAFPPDLPFTPYIDELEKLAPGNDRRSDLLKLSSAASVYDRCSVLADYLATVQKPHEVMLSIASLAASKELSGIRLLYGALLAVPPLEKMAEDMAGFHNVCRLMQKISHKEEAGAQMRESEIWFKKRMVLLSMSHPLPNSGATRVDEPWLDWSEGVRLALDSPDDRWDDAVLERLKVELEAADLRLKILAASLDPDLKGDLILFLYSLSEENKWRKQALEQAKEKFGGATLVIERRLGQRWNELIQELKRSDPGAALADVFDLQTRKTFSHYQLRTGASVLRALIMHPLLRKVQRAPDILSCASLFLDSAGGGILEIMIPVGRKLNALLDIPGFDLRERLLKIDLRRLPSSQFADLDEAPLDVDWTEVTSDSGVSYRSLVLQYIDNDNFLVELLGNPKATNKPGVLSTIALRCRSVRVLSIIANQRQFYTGIANKDVPLNLLMNPSKISLTSLRKFIHVRYVDRPTLLRMTNRGGQIREEVRREIMRYLSTMK
jgi:hypothetical protein